MAAPNPVIPVAFISSTSEDLKPLGCRAAAREAALAAKFYPEMQEYFAATATEPLAECLGRVAKANVLVAIVAWRYGWAPPDQKSGEFKSITWLECEEAIRSGKEVLAFLVEPNASWPLEHREEHRLAAAATNPAELVRLAGEVPRNMANLATFKQWLSSGRVRAMFTSKEDLQTVVERALRDWRERHREFDAATDVDLVPATNDPARYLEQLRDQTARIDIRGLVVGTGKAHSFPIEDLYVPLSTAAPMDQRGGMHIEAREERRVDLQEALRYRRLVIIGDPGSGKTTFLRRIGNALATARLEASRAVVVPDVEIQTTPEQRRSFSDRLLSFFGIETPKPERETRHAQTEQPFPVFIRVADLAEHIRKCSRKHDYDGPTSRTSAGWIGDYLKARSRANNQGLAADFFPRLLDDGNCLLMLDGLDEAAGGRERAAIARLFEEATRAYKTCRFIVTTRPLAYQGQATLDGFQPTRIEALDEDGVATFLGHWCRALFPHSPEQAERHLGELQSALAGKPEIRAMASNPVMLTALAVVHWNERRLPEQRADLYESILMWLARAREDKPGRVSADRSLKLLADLALTMQLRDPERVVQMPRRDAAEHLVRYFEPEAEKTALDLASEFVEAEEVDSGILISRGTDVRFWHLTFQEFLAARAIAGMGDTDQHKLLLEQNRVYRPEWRETALLLAGVLCGKQGHGKVDGLFRAALDEAERDGSLQALARAAGLLGAMVADLKPYTYAPGDRRFQKTLDRTYGVFEVTARGIPFQERLEAAQAVGQAGDRRLGLDKEENWITIPAGEFRMGSEVYDNSKPVHAVRLKRFRIAKHPVTVEDYKGFVEGKGYEEERWWVAGGFDGKRKSPKDWESQLRYPNRPVVNVSWYEAKAYCAWGGQRVPGLRLLKEAEWEYAARGKEGRTYAWGDEEPIAELANFSGGPGHPTPVGLYPSGRTPEGVMDMTGNVWEWVEDWYGEYSGRSVENPTGPAEGEEKVLRGGSWFSGAVFLVAFNRLRFRPDGRGVSFGFRCARE